MLTRRSRYAVGRRPGGYRGLVRTAVGGAAALYKGYRQYQSLRNSNKKSNTGFITNQYDVKTQYRRRRMPRRKRKAWMRKVRMVNTITNNKLGTQTQMLRSHSTGTIAAGSQTALSGGIFGENGTPAIAGDFGISDLFELNSRSADTGLLNVWNVKAGVLDVEITNIGGDSLNNSMTVDCYEIVCRRSLNSQGAAVIVGPDAAFPAEPEPPPPPPVVKSTKLLKPNAPLFPCGGLVGGVFPAPITPPLHESPDPPPDPPAPAAVGALPKPPPVDVIPAGPGLKLDGFP